MSASSASAHLSFSSYQWDQNCRGRLTIRRARRVVEQDATAMEADHGRLKARLRPMRGRKRLSSARTVAAGHAFVQNPRRGHYEIASDLPPRDCVALAFTALAHCL
jgi:hypothetical protein